MDLLAQLAEGIFPHDAKEKLVALLFGYFDESGTDGQHGFTVITGFVAPVSEWSSVVNEWDDRLRKDGINTFHYVECRHRQRQYLGWDWEADCKPHLEALSNIALNHGLAAINAGFTGDYAKLLPTLPRFFQSMYPSAYSICFEMLIARIRMATEQWRQEPIALIFAKHEQFQGLALERWNIAKGGKMWPEITHIGYAEPERVHQLQVADMLAWETRRYMWDKTRPEQIHDLPLLSKLVAKEKEHGNTLYEADMDEDDVRNMASAVVPE